MSSGDIQRSVRSARHQRAAGDAPSIGRVSRMPGTGLPREQRRRKRRSRTAHKDDSRRYKVLRSWLIVLSLASLCVLTGMVWGWFRTARQGDAVANPPVFTPRLESVRVASEFESPSNEVALALVRRGFGIRDAGEVGEVFRLGSVAPQDAVDRLAELAEESGGIRQMNWLSSVDANGLLLEAVLVDFEAGTPACQRLALLTPDENGVWKIDYEAYTRTSRPAWDEILDGGAGEAEVRVIATTDSYYNGSYRDESEWTCFGLSSPDIPEVLSAYCRKDSPQEEAMQRLVSADAVTGTKPGPRRVTLRLGREPGAGGRQFTIERVMAEDWVVAEPWFDERFR